MTGLAKHLVPPFFDWYDGKVMLGFERGHLGDSKNVKIQDLNHH